MSLKFIFDIVAANVISEAITAPTRQQAEAAREREWQIEKELLLRAKSSALISDLIRDKGYTDEQIVTMHRMADEELNKVLLADRQSITVSPASNNATNVIGQFVGGFAIGIIILFVLALSVSH